jgi:hypothetical protein
MVKHWALEASCKGELLNYIPSHNKNAILGSPFDGFFSLIHEASFCK